jgi:hypothetical protein
MIRYIRTIVSVIKDILKDELACFIVDFQNWTLKFRKKPKQKPFDESDQYFEPYKNDNT